MTLPRPTAFDLGEEKLRLLNMGSEIYLKMYCLEQQEKKSEVINPTKNIQDYISLRGQLHGICMAAQIVFHIKRQSFAQQIIEISEVSLE